MTFATTGTGMKHFLLTMMAALLLSNMAMAQVLRLNTPSQGPQDVCLDSSIALEIQSDEPVLTATAAQNDLGCPPGPVIEIISFSAASPPSPIGEAAPGDTINLSFSVFVPAGTAAPVCQIDGNAEVVEDSLPIVINDLLPNDTTQQRTVNVTVQTTPLPPNGPTDFVLSCNPGADTSSAMITIVDGQDPPGIVNLNAFSASQTTLTAGTTFDFIYGISFTDTPVDPSCTITAPTGTLVTNPIVIDPVVPGLGQRQSATIATAATAGQRVVTMSCQPGAQSRNVTLTISEDEPPPPPPTCPPIPTGINRQPPNTYAGVFSVDWGEDPGAPQTIPVTTGNYRAMSFTGTQTDSSINAGLFQWSEPFTGNGGVVSFSVSRCEAQFEPLPGDDLDCFVPFALPAGSIRWQFNSGSIDQTRCVIDRTVPYFLNMIFAQPGSPAQSTCGGTNCAVLIEPTR